MLDKYLVKIYQEEIFIHTTDLYYKEYLHLLWQRIITNKYRVNGWMDEVVVK